MSYIGNKPLTQAEKKTQQHTVTASKTIYPVSGGYSVGLIDVFLNGVLLLDNVDYSAGDGLNVTLLIATASDDTLVTVAWGSFVTNSESTPIGVMINFAGNTPPTGYLKCDGQELAQADYPDLYSAIGDLWNTTGGASSPAVGNFRLPPQDIDGLGLYMRGDGDATVVGEYQADVFKLHSHSMDANGEHVHAVAQSNTSGTDSDYLSRGTGANANNAQPIAEAGSHTHSLNANGDPTETRPRSITTLLCIKATNSAWDGNQSNIPANSVGETELQVAGLQSAGLLPTAWCRFNGILTGTNPPIDGFNVASVTRNGVGDYTINFTNDMDNLDFNIVSTSTSRVMFGVAPSVVGSCNVGSYSLDTAAAIDAADISLTVFGGKN